MLTMLFKQRHVLLVFPVDAKFFQLLSHEDLVSSYTSDPSLVVKFLQGMQKKSQCCAINIYTLGFLSLTIFSPSVVDLSFHYAKCSSASQFAVPSRTLGPAQTVLADGEPNTVTTYGAAMQRHPLFN